MERATRRLTVLTAQLRDSPNVGPALQLQSTASSSASVFGQVSQAPPDAILGITEAFKRDQNPKKINLGVGAYRTEEGKPLVLNVVRQAERRIVSNSRSDKEYLGIGGNPDFCRLSAILAFGEHSAVLQEKRNITVHSLSGTGSLRVGAEFLANNYPHKLIFLPTPTWPNHNKIFPLGGVKTQPYRYYKAQTRGLEYEGMLQDLRSAPEGSIVLLHACAHNPTGVDPTAEQWQGILKAVQERRLLPFFDSAYQGFATGNLEGDAHAIRLFADAGMEMLVAQSFAKNLGLYGERVGALTVVTSDPAVTKRVESQLKTVIRPLYSNPPRHGAAIVVAILSDPELYKQWRVELQGMADRIKSMRSQLFQALKDADAPGDWSHIVNQIGMFSYTGLTKEQVQNMTDKWHIYMTFDGRISMAGLSGAKCSYLAEAICDSVK